MFRFERAVITILFALVLLMGVACSKDETSELNEDLVKELIKETRINDLEFSDFFNGIEGVGITKFNISVSSSGFVNKMNLSYVMQDKDVEKTIVYRREEDLFEVYELNHNDDIPKPGTLEVFERFQYLRYNYESILNDDEVLEYELLNPTSITLDAGIGDILDGQELEEMEEVTGIIYHMYKIPVTQDGYSKLIISSED